MQILTKPTKEEFDSIMKMDSKEIIEKLKASGLTGRSGSNFPTGMKWEATLNSPGKHVLICNADEGEPGTFKDRFIIEKNLELLLQGMSVGKKALDAECYIYLRGEYEFLRKKLEKTAKNMGLDLTVVTGAGAYVCGEETALIESVEGRRGLPRSKPPYPTTHGLYGKPTCVNNVETIANVPLILSGKWKPDLRLFSVSGDVKKPGVYEVSTGKKFSDIAKLAGARPEAISFGYSGGLLPYEKYKDFLLDGKELSKNGFFTGPGAMIFLNKDIPKASVNIAEFFVHESCGKCVPCREGGLEISNILKKIESGHASKDDLKEIEDLCEYLGISFCPLGKSYGFVIGSAIKNFRNEFESKLTVSKASRSFHNP